MELGQFLWTSLGAFLTLSVFSFLYKDNPMYKFAEHLFVGVSAGYFVIILWHNGLVTNLYERLADGHIYFLWLDSAKWWYIFPAILGIMMFTRFSRKWSWVSRWPVALYIGIATGLAIPLEMANRVNRQLYAMMEPINWGSFFGSGWLDMGAGYSDIIIFVGTVSALIYFYFSKAHTGVFGSAAKLGIWTLMLGFGASFGFTVMARISLLINRIQFLDKNWKRNSFDTNNENFSAGYQVVFWLIILVFAIYAASEFLKYLKNRDRSSVKSA